MIRLAPGLIASFVILFAAQAALAQPGPPLRIVVLSGEDSVNVIQQKTAVAPLVEVRDRNNVPVPGAVVTFAVQGGKTAVFQGGASTITVATNAAGQAAATGLTPMTAGAVNISVEAAFQGQVVTAAISQVNVVTAAEAAAAASATGAGSGSSTAGATGGAAGGSGGGVSATTIGIIGGAAAAGTVAATQVGGEESGGESVSGGTYVGTFSMNVAVPFGGCARQENYSGTLRIVLTSTTGSIAGTMEIRDGRGAVTSTTCSGPIQPGPIGTGGWGMPNAPVTGTEPNMAAHSSDVVPTIENNGTTISRTFDFTGSLAGSAINGQIRMVWRNSQPNFPLMDMTTSITLAKQ